MDLISWVALGVITAVNVGGWAYTKAYGYGKLNQKVKNLEKNQNSINDILNNGLVQQVSEIKASVARLEGTVNTYIELTKRGK